MSVKRRRRVRPRLRKSPHYRRSLGVRRSTRRRFRSTEPGSVSIEMTDQSKGALVFRIPKKVRSLNKLKTGIARHGDTVAWEAALRKVGRPATTSDAERLVFADIVWPDGKRRLEIERQAPTERYFLDQTNFAGGCKGLEDALVRLGYLVDDSLKWLDGPHLKQTVAPDRKFWTIIRVTSTN
jgi:hypothetical protein